MRHGVVFSQTEFGNDPAAIKDYAQAAEGLGWNHAEYESLGEYFRTRGGRAEEQVEVFRKLWTEPLVAYRSADHVIDNAGLNPMPIQRPIPIWFGGAAEPALKRAARLGDGWMPAGRSPDDRAKAYIEQLHGYLEEAGRDRKNFGIDPWISIQGLNKDEWHHRVEAWRTMGASHVAVNTMGAGFTSPQAHIDAIRSFREVLN